MPSLSIDSVLDAVLEAVLDVAPVGGGLRAVAVHNLSA
jgi:hypothetical protein